MMLKSARLAIVIALATTWGDTRSADLDPSRAIGEQITVKSTEFDTNKTFLGPELRAKSQPNDELWIKVMASRNKKTGATQWGLVLQAKYEHRWRMYKSVSLSGGKQIATAPGMREVLNCSYGICTYLESAVAALDEEDVKQALGVGLKTRWNASQGPGAFEIEIPADYFYSMQQATLK